MRGGGIVAVATILMISSCTTQLETFVTEPPVEGWSEGVVIEIENRDTVGLYDISLFTRVRNPLVVSSFEVEVMSSTPDSVSYRDTILITTQQGERVSDRLYRRDSRWSRVGRYELRITPLGVVDGVEAIGLRRSLK